MTQPLVDLVINRKRFADRLIISDVAFQVAPGEIVSLVGPSGCGKSTCFASSHGLDSAYDGQVSVLGHAPRLHLDEVGLVFQEPRLLPWLTVAQNVGFELGPKGGRDARVAELLAEVGLAEHANAYPKQLSGGQSQRAAIAGACSPAETAAAGRPFSAVDAFTRMRLQDLLKTVAARHDATLLLVTHDIGEAVYLSDRVIVLASNPGHVRGQVTVDVAHPRDRRDPQLALREGQALQLLEDAGVRAGVV